MTTEEKINVEILKMKLDAGALSTNEARTTLEAIMFGLFLRRCPKDEEQDFSWTLRQHIQVTAMYRLLTNILSGLEKQIPIERILEKYFDEIYTKDKEVGDRVHAYCARFGKLEDKKS